MLATRYQSALDRVREHLRILDAENTPSPAQLQNLERYRLELTQAREAIDDHFNNSGYDTPVDT